MRKFAKQIFTDYENITILLTILIALSFSNPSLAKEEDEIIRVCVVTHSETNGKRTNRTPARIPVRALYLSSASSIQVTFNYDIGNVDISISNEATGESVSYDVDSQTGLCILPISGDTGLWSITFTLESGVQYQGEFSVL